MSDKIACMMLLFVVYNRLSGTQRRLGPDRGATGWTATQNKISIPHSEQSVYFTGWDACYFFKLFYIIPSIHRSVKLPQKLWRLHN